MGGEVEGEISFVRLEERPRTHAYAALASCKQPPPPPPRSIITNDIRSCRCGRDDLDVASGLFELALARAFVRSLVGCVSRRIKINKRRNNPFATEPCAYTTNEFTPFDETSCVLYTSRCVSMLSHIVIIIF